MKDAFVRTKDKAERGLYFDKNSPSEYAADKISHTADRAVDECVHQFNKQGQKAFEDTRRNVGKAREKIKTYKEQKAAQPVKQASDLPKEQMRQQAQFIRRSANSTIRTEHRSEDAIKHSARSGRKTIKSTAKGTVKTAYKSVKTAEQTAKTTIKTNQQITKAAGTAAANMKQAALAAVNTAQKAEQAARAAAKAAVAASKAALKATIATVKAIMAATKALISAIVAGSWVAVVIIIVICLIGLLLGSGFGIFFANDVPDGAKLSTVVQELSDEYYEQIRDIEQRVPHDYVEYEASDGITALVWPDVLSVYAARTAIDTANGMEVVTVTPEKRQKIRDVLWDMNQVGYRTYQTQREIEVEKTDKYGKPYLDTEVITETHLVIEVTRKQPQEMAQTYTFNARQNEQLALLLDSQYNHLWIRLLGNLQGGSIGGAHDGEIMQPGIGGSGVLAWPLPIAGSISSPFGYRQDPFDGKWSFHRGLDIAAPNGTPILAAADGTVVVANATDSWGYSWGYYVKIEHANGMTTLYAHSSTIAVNTGQHVQKGEVIAYVGSTGASTGNHLHWEVVLNGELTDALQCL